MIEAGETLVRAATALAIGASRQAAVAIAVSAVAQEGSTEQAHAPAVVEARPAWEASEAPAAVVVGTVAAVEVVVAAVAAGGNELCIRAKR